MAFRVYLTHSCTHKNGFFQAKGENVQLHRAVSLATTAYLQDGVATVPGNADAIALAAMLERAWDNIAGDPRNKCETVVSDDKRLVVEIFR